MFVFDPDRPLSTRVSARVGRWAIQLMAYDFKIEHEPGDRIPHVDALSRLSMDSSSELVFSTIEEAIPFEEPTSEILKEIKLQPEYQRLKAIIRSGRWNKVERQYFHLKAAREQLTVENDLIYFGTKLFIPTALRKDVLRRAHDTHMGIQQQFNKVNKEFWWPGMYNDIKRFIKACGACQKLRGVRAQYTTKWPTASPWERVHMDWAYVKNRGNILIIVDTGSNYIEAIPCNNRSAIAVRRSLARIFAHFGLPKCIVSDNAPEFLTQRMWLENMGVKMLQSPTYHPQSNGAAERAVATIKKCLEAWNPQCGDWFCFLQKILLNHRSSSGQYGNSPGARLMNRELRTSCNKYSLLEPAYYKTKFDKQAREVTVVSQAGQNTALVSDDSTSWLASFDQLAKKEQCQEETCLQTPMGWKSKRQRKSPDFFIQGGK